MRAKVKLHLVSNKLHGRNEISKYLTECGWNFGINKEGLFVGVVSHFFKGAEKCWDECHVYHFINISMSQEIHYFVLL